MSLICCSICLEESPRAEGFSVIRCGHAFHRDCIIELVEVVERSNCPTCRQGPIRRADMRPLFVELVDSPTAEEAEIALATQYSNLLAEQAATAETNIRLQTQSIEIEQREYAVLSREQRFAALPQERDKLEAWRRYLLIVVVVLVLLLTCCTYTYSHRLAGAESAERDSRYALDAVVLENQQLRDEIKRLQSRVGDIEQAQAAERARAQKIDIIPITLERAPGKLPSITFWGDSQGMLAILCLIWSIWYYKLLRNAPVAFYILWSIFSCIMYIVFG